jgi:NADH-quinone oxidoreductase subunit L
MNVLPVLILLPAVLASLLLIIPGKVKGAKEVIALAGSAANLIIAAFVYGKLITFNMPLCGYGLDFSLRLYHFSAFIILAASGFSFLAVLYSTVFMKGKALSKQFYVYLLFTIALVNGAVLANNLIVLLFFWEGLLVTMFVMIMIGGKSSYKTSVKMVVLVGLTDLCMMLGMGMIGYLAKTYEIDKINLPLSSWGIFAFILLMLGAITKAGAMPFHTWIPDAATDAPLPFMALLPAALEKLLGIYFLARICLDIFQFKPLSSMSYLLMIIGSVTILFAVMMALIQKDYKRLLSYHAISQVGYMILGIGTGLPIGIVGGLFHMVNHAMYKSCLFYTGGAVEKQTGTTDLRKLGGLGRKMPVTFICFIVAAAAISGVPPLNGFFSKELIFDGALQLGGASGMVFYIVAALGAFFTAISFLKLGHAAFLGKPTEETEKVKEAPWPMLVPMIVLAFGCVLFGVYNPLPINNLIQPILGKGLVGSGFAGLPQNWVLVAISVVVLLLALLDHIYGSRKTHSGLGASDHFHYAPVLSTIYGWAELRYFDVYHVGGYVIRGFSNLSLLINKGIDWFYDKFLVWLVSTISRGLSKAHNGSQALYLGWVLAGVCIVITIFLVSI